MVQVAGPQSSKTAKIKLFHTVLLVVPECQALDGDLSGILQGVSCAWKISYPAGTTHQKQHPDCLFWLRMP
jgi:hypothetical protein